MSVNSTYFTTWSSPIGGLLLTWCNEQLKSLWIAGEKHAPPISPHWREDAAPFAGAISQLEEYFAGERRQFDLPLGASGTAFQEAVWAGLMTIPYGGSMSYSSLARQIGNPKAVRAVGMANGRNPVSIIVPCHRVIGQNGSLTGYGGGLKAKSWLLDHEARHFTYNLNI